MEKKIGIIGMGKMGAPIARMLARADYEVTGYDIEEIRLSSKIEVASSVDSLLEQKAPVILAVKPNLIGEIAAKVPDNRLIISVAAGVDLASIAKARKVPGPVIRVMPNAPLAIKEGISVLCAGEGVTEEEKQFALDIFLHGGDAFYIEDEKNMHIVTALSGSGPAFVELFLQTMEDAGVLMGLSRPTARRLSLATVHGTAKMVQKSARSPQEFIHDVTSPGGTTIAGLQVLKDFGMERALLRAIKRSAQRSSELGSSPK